MYALILSCGRSAPEHKWRLEKLTEATCAARLFSDFGPDRIASVSEYRFLRIERFDFWLPDRDNDSHRPLVFSIAPVHDKKDYRSAEKKATKKDREYNKYGYYDTDRAKWEPIVLDATGFNLNQKGRFRVGEGHERGSKQMASIRQHIHSG